MLGCACEMLKYALKKLTNKTYWEKTSLMKEVIANQLWIPDPSQSSPTAISQCRAILLSLYGLNKEAQATATFSSWVCLQGSFNLLLQDPGEKARSS